MPNHPTRLVHLDEARARFGPSIDSLAELLHVGDPLCDGLLEATETWPRGKLSAMVDRALSSGIAAVDGAPPELVALFAELDRVPAWVDPRALERGGELLYRAGWFGGLALATSLLLGYASPGGNKPLVFSGRLNEQAPRRLIETSRFVDATCQPSGLSRFSDGFAITVKVRLMHAHVRRMILRSGRWSDEDWGLPANQHDMGGTGLLFSVVVIDTLKRFGFELDEEEIHLYMQLWRYSGYLMGVHPDVLPTSYLEGQRLADMIAATEEGPDDDSRRLSRALFASGEDPKRATPEETARAKRIVKLGQGLIRGVIGEELADLLDVPRHRYRHAFTVARVAIERFERTRGRLPRFAQRRLRAASMDQGKRYWDMLIRATNDPLTFAPPEALLGIAAPVASASTRRGRTLASVARPR